MISEVVSRIQHMAHLIKNQGAYNDDKHPLDSKPYTNTNQAQSRSGSVSEEGTGASSTSIKYDLQKSTDGNNSGIGSRGFGS